MHTTEQLNAALDGRYLIERQVGEGGMATVYLARDLRHNRPVALKVLKPDLGAVVGVERFLAEIQVTANLQHPNLLPLFDSGAAGGLLFYVMPFVEGESLRDRLHREKQLPLEQAVHIAGAVASALDYAHRRGVIHRDLKPENILLVEGEPLVADFGIALAVSNAGGSRITQTGLSLGTPQYMSPEQATGDRTIDGRADIYSLGAVLYEMLTGEPPHTGSTSQAVIARVLTETPRSIRVTRPHVPAYVEAAVDRALEKLPADRWATAKDLAEAIAGAKPMVGDAPGATRPSARGLRSWDRRTLALLGVVGVLMVALAWSVTRSSGGSASVPRVYDVGLPDSAPLSFTGGSPWGEGWTALALLDELLSRVEGEERAKVQNRRNELVKERPEYAQDRLFQARHEFEKKQDTSKAVWWLVHSVAWLGDEALEDEAARVLVKMPDLASHLLGYKAKYPDRYALVMKNSVVADWAERNDFKP